MAGHCIGHVFYPAERTPATNVITSGYKMNGLITMFKTRYQQQKKIKTRYRKNGLLLSHDTTFTQLLNYGDDVPDDMLD
jgi:hypothetical protein